MMIELIEKLRFLQVGAIPNASVLTQPPSLIPTPNLEIPDSDSSPRPFWVRLAALANQRP